MTASFCVIGSDQGAIDAGSDRGPVPFQRDPVPLIRARLETILFAHGTGENNLVFTVQFPFTCRKYFQCITGTFLDLMGTPGLPDGNCAVRRIAAQCVLRSRIHPASLP